MRQGAPAGAPSPLSASGSRWRPQSIARQRPHNPSTARQPPPLGVARRQPAQSLSRLPPLPRAAGKKAGAKRDAGDKPAAKEPKKAKKEPVEAADVEMKEEVVVGSGRQAAQVRATWARLIWHKWQGRGCMLACACDAQLQGVVLAASGQDVKHFRLARGTAASQCGVAVRERRWG